jgi:hypothetical protein
LGEIFRSLENSKFIVAEEDENIGGNNKTDR